MDRTLLLIGIITVISIGMYAIYRNLKILEKI